MAKSQTNTLSSSQPKNNKKLIDTVLKGTLEQIQELCQNYPNITKITNREGSTLLHFAAKRGDAEIAKFLLESNFSVDITNDNGTTPLHWATEAGNENIFHYFIENGANIQIVNNMRDTLLHRAYRSKNKNIIEYLLKNGVPVDVVNNKGVTPLHLAAANGDDEVFFNLIGKLSRENSHCDESSPPKSVQNKDMYGSMLLHYAARGGNVSIVEYALKFSDVDCTNIKQTTPLYWAAQYGQREVFDLLVKKGANINAINDSKDTLVHYASMGGNIDILKYVADNSSNFNVNTPNIHGKTPLHLACNHGHISVVKFLTTDYNPDINSLAQTIIYNNRSNKYEHSGELFTPIFGAVTSGNVELLEIMLELYNDPNAINAVTTWGNTLLHKAVANEDLGMIGFLLKLGASPNCCNNREETPLHTAASLDNKEIVELLLANEAYPDMQGALGVTPLYIAAKLDSKEIVALLLANKATPDIGDGFGSTPLHMAAKLDNKEIVELLLAYNATPNIVDNNGNTPLHLSVLKGNIESTKYLLNLGANANYCNRSGDTPLHMTAKLDSNEIVELLLANKANLNAQNRDGNTLLHLSVSEGNIESVKYLLPFCDASIRNDMGNIPVYTAILENKEEIATYLIEHCTPAILQIQNALGQCALEIAMDKGRETLTALILAKYSNMNGIDENGLALNLDAMYINNIPEGEEVPLNGVIDN